MSTYENECHRRGFARAAEEIFRSLEVPGRQAFQELIKELLTDRENTAPTEERKRALDLLSSWARKIASFGVDINIKNGFSEFCLPPIESTYLVETGIIVDPETIAQIEERASARKEREKGPPENRLTIKALTPEETRGLPSGIREALTSPIISLEESYTVTLPKEPSLELDRISKYVLGQTSNGMVEIFFLGETQKPHAHTRIVGRWYRIDHESHEDFRVSPDITLPPSKTVKEPCPATNDQIATLLVLFRYSIAKA